MDEPSSTGTDAALMQVIDTSECVKAVVLSAHRINLLALNALLLSRKSGDAAAGFGEVSAELRLFSRQLSLQMTELRNQAAVAVVQISAALKRGHLQRLLQRVEPQAAAPLAPALARMAEQQLLFEQLAASRQRQLRQLLELAHRHCRYGAVIARFAKIEAAYGQALSRQLAAIADDFTLLMDGVLPQIERLWRLEGGPLA